LNDTIQDLYERTGHTQSAEIYQERLQESEFYQQSIIKPELPWYRSIFEKF
ncbi:outer membrane protein assembly factor BamD, partial [Campylobacter coli]|nr:outer membrane protein assembly factor BamD [Campylobacter coli]